MTRPQDGYTRVESPTEIEALLEALSEPGGASLQLESGGGKPLPVLVAEQQPGGHLLLDISAIREIAGELGRGAPFRLLGQARGKMLRTPPLAMSECHEAGERLHCTCAYPSTLEVLQRRDSFRARLRLGMEVGVIVRDGGEEAPFQGDLKDLSLEGCQLELPLGTASRLASSQPLELEFCFPNGSRFVIQADPRHHVVDTERQVVRAGFRFIAPSGAQERQLWFFVREIERESARQSNETDISSPASSLFQGEAATSTPVGRRNVQAYATPMAKRLARVAGYLDAQLLELQRQGPLDPVLLSRHADRLLLLHDEDREGLLFATRCMRREPMLVRHGLAVAVHLLDLAATGSMPRDARKAMVASAMVHDLGKALLPRALLEAPALETAQRAELHTHVALLRPRLGHCHWLASSVVEAVVERINERLDGSGYPDGLRGERLHELTRLAMVVDVVEAMRRDRPDRPAWRVAEVYRHLLSRPEQFDQRWVKRYIRHFGLLPIGSLVRFEGGELGWVQGLDERGRPARVQLAEEAVPPGESLGEVLHGAALAKLGAAVEEVAVSC
ncbi:HD domain-containing phosphohydrolase [Halomonas sp. C05BenzN]|uniref:HD domain-containing phosphohydrolase n=1 Tax=Halomonas sp. C05BenzN TaxID=3411041 RepID=UPI003B931507